MTASRRGILSLRALLSIFHPHLEWCEAQYSDPHLDPDPSSNTIPGPTGKNLHARVGLHHEQPGGGNVIGNDMRLRTSACARCLIFGAGRPEVPNLYAHAAGREPCIVRVLHLCDERANEAPVNGVR